MRGRVSVLATVLASFFLVLHSELLMEVLSSNQKLMFYLFSQCKVKISRLSEKAMLKLHSHQHTTQKKAIGWRGD